MYYIRGTNTYIKKAHIFLTNQRQKDTRLKHMLLHPDICGYPKINTILTGNVNPTSKDKLTIERLLEAYRKAEVDEAKVIQRPELDVWVSLKQKAHADFLNLLQKENVDTLAYYLCNMARMDISEGIEQGANEYKKILTNRKYRSWLSQFNLDKLITLAEALGVLPYENPEQGRFGFNMYCDVDDIVENIERNLRINIIPPLDEGGSYKLNTGKGALHYRDIFSLYTAWRIKKILENEQNPIVCEIGAGVGKVAYYTHLFDIKNYTIIDLPYINVLQGFYLIRSLPSVEVILYGENQGGAKNPISILPYWSFEDIPEKYFTLTLNQDSFPEIDRKIVMSYLNLIKHNTKTYFLSINQEGESTMSLSGTKQNIVLKLINEVKGFESVYRFPFWLRKGYIEELFKIS
jgi:hypothetical protein